jgi:integrase
MLTGQRRQEVAAMTWNGLDMEGNMDAAAKRTKNGIEHEVPLSKQALVVLKNIGRQDGRDFVFGIGKGPSQDS